MTTIRLLFFGAVMSGMIFSGCKKDETTAPIAGGPVTISGRIVSPLMIPFANFPVYIPGKAPTSTDASGRFSIPNVTPPYTLVFVDRFNQVSIFKGLTRTDPIFSSGGYNADTGRATNYSGVLHNGSYPQPAGYQTYSMYLPQNGIPSGLWQSTITDSSFVTYVSWFGPSTTSGAVKFLQVQNSPQGLPLQFTGLGAISNVTFTNNVPVNLATISLTDPRDTIASGTITLPAGYTESSRAAGVWMAQDSPSFFWTSDTSRSSTFNCAVSPEIGTFALRVSASNATSQSSFTKALRPGPGNAISVPSGVQLTLPPAATTNVDTNTIFSWTPTSTAVYVVMFRALSVSAPTFTIYTNETSISIPNLSAIGYGIPSSGSYGWRVVAYSPVGGVDDLTGPTSRVLAAGGFPIGTDGYVTIAAERLFTARP